MAGLANIVDPIIEGLLKPQAGKDESRATKIHAVSPAAFSMAALLFSTRAPTLRKSCFSRTGLTNTEKRILHLRNSKCNSHVLEPVKNLLSSAGAQPRQSSQHCYTPGFGVCHHSNRLQGPLWGKRRLFSLCISLMPYAQFIEPILDNDVRLGIERGPSGLALSRGVLGVCFCCAP